MFGAFVENTEPMVVEEPSALQITASQPAEEVSALHTMALHLAEQSEVVLKSQQREEPELTVQERLDLALQLYDKSPSQFLYRFGRYLKIEHLSLFEQLAASDPVTAHYLKDAHNTLDKRKQLVKVHNRRWAAVRHIEQQQSSSASSNGGDSLPHSLSDHSDYFTEAAMRSREPLLYEQLVGRHLTDEERQQRLQDFDKSDCRMSTIIFDHLDRMREKERYEFQSEREADMFEEEEDSSDESLEADRQKAEKMLSDESDSVDEHGKNLLRNEFVTSMYSNFIYGKDAFNYKNIDENDELDLLDLEDHDKEEKYFDGEEPQSAPMYEDDDSNSNDFLDLPPRSCLNRPATQRGEGAQRQHDGDSELPQVESLAILSDNT